LALDIIKNHFRKWKCLFYPLSVLY
jgi:hypothetical protein